MQNLLTPKQVAERLQCSVTTVHSMVKDGRLAHIRIGSGTVRKTIRIPESALEQLAGTAQRDDPRPLPKDVVPLHPRIAKLLAR